MNRLLNIMSRGLEKHHVLKLMQSSAKKSQHPMNDISKGILNLEWDSYGFNVGLLAGCKTWQDLSDLQAFAQVGDKNLLSRIWSKNLMKSRHTVSQKILNQICNAGSVCDKKIVYPTSVEKIKSPRWRLVRKKRESCILFPIIQRDGDEQFMYHNPSIQTCDAYTTHDVSHN